MTTPNADVLRRRRAVAGLWIAAGARMDDATASATRGLWDAMMAPYAPEEVEDACMEYLRRTSEMYGRLPAPGAIVALIREAAATRRREDARAREAAATRVRADARAMLDAADRALSLAVATARALPPAEGQEAVRRAQNAYAETSAAITANVRAGVSAALAAPSAAALEVRHDSA